MTYIRIGKNSLVKLSAIALMCSLPTVGAAEGLKPEIAVKMRQGFMRTQLYQFSYLGEVGKGNIPYNDEAAKRAEHMKNLAQIIPDMFATPSSLDIVDGTRALPKIWEQPEEVNKRISRLQSETARLAQVAKQGDAKALATQVKRVGNACKACHDDFRKPKEKKS